MSGILTVRQRLWRVWYGPPINCIPNVLRHLADFCRVCKFTFLPPKHSRHLPRHVRFFIQVDPEFRSEQAALEVVRRREALRARGINLREQGYPDLFGVLQDWGDHHGRFWRRVDLRHVRQGH